MVNGYRPQTLDEALKIRANTGAIPLAGGTDLMVRHKNIPGALPGFEKPVVFISHLEEIRGVEAEDGIVKIGAATPLAELENDERIPAILREAISNMAARNVRHIATIGGNVCNASPAGDTLVPLYALDAGVKLASVNGVRTLPVEDFITGPGQTALAPDEILTEIVVPTRSFTREYYRKVGTRKAMALSRVSFAALADVNGGVIEDIRFAFGAVAPTVVRSREIEKQFISRTVDEIKGDAPQWAQKFAPLLKPIDDQRASAQYRRKVAINLAVHFLEEIL